MQLQDVLSTRHSVFITGPTASGKTTCWKSLAAAKAVLGMPTIVRVFNPKAVSVEELYGCMVLASREWKDVRFAIMCIRWYCVVTAAVRPDLACKVQVAALSALYPCGCPTFLRALGFQKYHEVPKFWTH